MKRTIQLPDVSQLPKLPDGWRWRSVILYFDGDPCWGCMSDSSYEFGETPEEAADKAWQSADFDAMRLRPELSTPEPEKPHDAVGATCHTCNGTKKKPSLTGDIHFDEPCPECSTDESPIFRAEYMGEWVPEKPAEPPLPPPPEGWKWWEFTTPGGDSGVIMYKPNTGYQAGWIPRERANWYHENRGRWEGTAVQLWNVAFFGPKPPDFDPPKEDELLPPPVGCKWHECTVRGEDSVVLYEPGAGVHHGWMSRAHACKGGYTPSVQTRRTHWPENVFGPEPPDFRKREGA